MQKIVREKNFKRLWKRQAADGPDSFEKGVLFFTNLPESETEQIRRIRLRQ